MSDKPRECPLCHTPGVFMPKNDSPREVTYLVIGKGGPETVILDQYTMIVNVTGAPEMFLEGECGEPAQ